MSRLITTTEFVSQYIGRVLRLAGHILAIAATCVLFSHLSVNRRSEAHDQKADFESKVAKTVQQYCMECHGPKKQSGNVNLSEFKTVADVQKDRATWETVLERLRERAMPPKDKPQPSDNERAEMVKWIETELKSMPHDQKSGPGRVTLRRLNRAEYSNTVRDLFGMEFQVADSFPLDDVGYGFDNIGDVLSTSPLLMEKYLAAADQILEKVFEREQKIKPTARLFQARERDFKMTGRNTVLPEEKGRLVVTGEMMRAFRFEHAGEYRFQVRAIGHPLAEENPKVSFKVDGKEIQQFEIGPKRDKSGGSSARNASNYVAKAKLTAGEHSFGIELLNPKTDEKDSSKERSVLVLHMELDGPNDLPPPEPSLGYKKLMITLPDGELPNDVAARRILSAFVRRAYRRPPSDTEVDALVQLVKLARDQGDNFEGGLRVALKAVLVSPHFLFKVERDPPKAIAGEAYPISELELATRMSYFLWSSMPDDELLRLAQFGKLRQPDIFEKQVRRMLADPKSRALADNFASQWLQIRNLKSVAIDPKTFPTFDESLRTAMMEETTRFFDCIVRDDRRVTEFLDADFTFVNERLAKHYGIKGIAGPEFRKITLNGTHRAGVLTHAAILTVNSNPTRTSPVKRGKFIVENILGATIPPPPPDVPDLDDDGKELTGSLRQRLEQHRLNPNCASCHERMDPAGLAFEHFDGIGAWREKDGQHAIDASGTLPDGRKFKDDADLRGILKEKPEAFRRCLAEKLLTYALGRGLDYKDRGTVDEISRQTNAAGDRFSALVLAIVNSEPFQKRTCAKGSR